MQNQKKDYERQLEDLTNKMTVIEEQKKDIARQQTSSESEFDK